MVSGRPCRQPPPMASLNRAMRHRLDVNNLRHAEWLREGGSTERSIATNCPGRLQVQSQGTVVEVIVRYVVVGGPQQLGEGFLIAKYYFSHQYQYQWIHVRPAPGTAQFWVASPNEFIL